MEAKLSAIEKEFDAGHRKQAQADVQALISESADDSQRYKAHDALAKMLNRTGQHEDAVQAWKKAIELIEAGNDNIDDLPLGKLIDWVNISLTTAKVMFQQGVDGPNVSHRDGSVSYGPSSISEDEMQEWKLTRMQAAVECYQKVLPKIPDSESETKMRVRTRLAEALLATGNLDEAVKIYEEAFNNDGDAEWLYKAADCSWKQGKKEQAYTRLQQLIATEPRFAQAYQLCATYFTEQNDTAQAEEYTRQFQFYRWVPNFCQHVKYEPENVSLVEALSSGDHALECIETKLLDDTSKRSSELLASVCFHHAHGVVEDRAFEILEQRGIASEGADRAFIGSLLMTLIRRHQSLCTIKGATNALAGMKYEELFDVLIHLLPQDRNVMFPMEIPRALAKLGDRRAIPHLIETIEQPADAQGHDSDSSDDYWMLGLSSAPVVECCLALSKFFDDESVKAALKNGVNQENIRQACLAVLAVCTNEQPYFDELQKSLADDHTLDYQVAYYLKQHATGVAQVEKLLTLNDEIRNKGHATNENEGEN